MTTAKKARYDTWKSLGEECQLAEDVRILKGHMITLGNHVTLKAGVILEGGGSICLGDHTMVGPGTIITAEPVPGTAGPGNVSVGAHVWIGAGCTIGPEVRIGDGAVILPGAVVTGHVPAGSRAAGVPAKILEDKTRDIIWKLEANIDDCSGEALGLAMEHLMKAGARDVHYTPVFMKKNRPAYQLNVICGDEKREELEEIIFRDTTTIGIRRYQMERAVMERSFQVLETPMGKVQLKICKRGSVEKIYPEYEDLAEICRKTELGYAEAYGLVLEEYRRQSERE